MSSLLALAAALALAPAQPAPKDMPSAPVPEDSSREAGPPAAPTPALNQPVPRASPRFTALVLRNEGIALDDLPTALALRLPDLPIVRESPQDGSFVFVAIRSDPATPVRHQIGVITSDGAAYYREVDTGADPPARVLASVLANLLVSIAEGRVQPDRTDVAIPPSDTEPNPDPKPEPKPKPKPEPKPPPPRPPIKSVPKTIPQPPRWEYGPSLAGALTLALPPEPFASPLAAAGGSLGLDARHRRGLLLGLEFRGLGRAATGHGLARLRIAVMAGYALRRGRFELPIALGLSGEPWWLDGDIFRPLYGALLRTSPGIYLAQDRGPLRGLRVGPRIELAGSFIVDNGPHIAGISQQGDSARTPLFRLGGLELSLGLELTLWFARPAPQHARPTPASR